MRALLESRAWRRALAGAAVVVSVVVAVLVASNGRSEAGHVSREAPCAGTPDGLLTVRSGDRDRKALVRTPAGARGRRAPLVVALHGAGSSGPAMEDYSGLSTVAAKEGFIVAYPSAARSDRFWALRPAHSEGIDDMAFIRSLVEQLTAQGCADPSRVYVAGISNGGGMAARAACELSDRVAAVVAVAGGYGNLPPCRPDRPVSVLEIHGTGDSVVPYEGRPEDGRSGAVLPWLAAWAKRDGCAAAPVRKRLATRTVRLRWQNCRDGSVVEHLALAGGPHDWPGTDPPAAGPRPQVSAALEAWRFLRAKHLAPPRA